MDYNLIALCILAREIVKKEDLVSRGSVIQSIVDDGEHMDEECWVRHSAFGSPELRVVSPKISVMSALRKERTELFQEENLLRVFTPDNPGAYRRIMSWCKEFSKDGRTWADIVIHNEGSRLCVKRFLETKEALHLYTRTVTDQERHEKFLADVMLQQSQDGRRFISNPNEYLDPEAVGFYLAIEVLLPWCLREEYNVMASDSRITNFQIAKRFMIPEFVVWHVRNVRFDKKNYMATSYEINTQIDKMPFERMP